MICTECEDSGQIERSKRLVWSPIETNIRDVIYETEELIEIGGQDACMACTRRAEIEYIAWSHDCAT
tara:strand:- start:256 stop:456 length:201 start_codon:yes stop_codon:yes gene_type:complete